MRPIVIIDMGKLSNLEQAKNPLLEALLHTLVLVREKMLLPHHLEKWTLILDTNRSPDLTNINDFFTELSEKISEQFPQTLEKVLIINDGSLQGEPLVFKRRSIYSYLIHPSIQ
jgi:hypothetical protein